MTSKLLFDTNFFIDVALKERPGHKEAARLLEACTHEALLGIVSSLSLKDFFYITRKSLSNARAHTWIQTIMTICDVSPVDRTTCQQALLSANLDFEDALIEATAIETKVDYLITRDLEGFERLTVPRLSAAEFLALQES